VTEDEMDIIAKRVALQQRQFAEYEKRERARKTKKIRAMFDYVGDEEISEMLEDCGNDEVSTWLSFVTKEKSTESIY
jgi:hypothetical protein